jgi:tetratricopeptide (TPR) repeat protein
MFPIAIVGIVVVVVVIGAILALSNQRPSSPTALPGITATAVVAVLPTAQVTTPPTGPATTPAAVAQTSDKYAKLSDQVNQLLVNGSTDNALPLVEAALKDDPQSYDLLALRGRVYAESGDDVRDKAEPDAQAAIKIDPKRPEAYVVLGQYYMIVKDSLSNDERIAQYKKAIASYTQAIDMGTQDYHAYWGRALASNWLNGYVGTDNGVPDSSVLGDIEKATSFSPHDPRFFDDRGHFYLDRYNFAEAQKSYEQVLTLRPQRYDDHAYLAITYLAQDMKQKAYDLYANAIEKDNVHDHKYLADAAYVAWVNGKSDKANEWAKLALALDPDTPAANYLLALLAWDKKNYDEALKQLDNVLKSSEAYRYTFPFYNRRFNRLVYADRARILAEKGELDDAVDAYSDALKDEQYWPELYIEQAKIYLKQDKKEEARQDLRTALDYAISQKDDKARTDTLALLEQLGPGEDTATPES